jgi:transporter family-2 protein
MPKLVYMFPLLAGFCVCLQGTMNGHWQSRIGLHVTILVNGLCGFIILTIAALTFPIIGAASVIVLMVAGQLVTAAAFDHLGILNLPQQPLSLVRLTGIAFVGFGVFLTTRP